MYSEDQIYDHKNFFVAAIICKVNEVELFVLHRMQKMIPSLVCLWGFAMIPRDVNPTLVGVDMLGFPSKALSTAKGG